MFKVLLSAIVLEALFGGAYSKMVSGSDCSKPHLQDNFDLSKYTGYWYEIYRDPTFYWEKDSTCGTAQYIPKSGEEGVVTVMNTQTTPKGELSTMDGTAT